MRIQCHSCEYILTEKEIFENINQEFADKYRKFKENIKVNTSKTLKWCPNPGCGKYVSKGKSRKVVCECGF